MVASTDSQGQIALLQLDGDSLIAKEIKILLDVDKWYCDVQFLDLPFNCFLYFVVFTLFGLKENWWLMEQVITKLPDLLLSKRAILNVSITEVFKVAINWLFMREWLSVSSSFLFVSV